MSQIPLRSTLTAAGFVIAAKASDNTALLVALVGLGGVLIGSLFAFWQQRSAWRRDARLSAYTELVDAYHGFDFAVSDLEDDGVGDPATLARVRSEFLRAAELVAVADSKASVVASGRTVFACRGVMVAVAHLMESVNDPGLAAVLGTDRWRVAAWAEADAALNTFLNAARRELRPIPWLGRDIDFRAASRVI